MTLMDIYLFNFQHNNCALIYSFTVCLIIIFAIVPISANFGSEVPAQSSYGLQDQTNRKQEAQLMLTNPCDAMLYILYIIGSDDVRLSYCIFSIFKRRPSTILDFHIFVIFVKNLNLCLNLCRHAKFGEDRTIRCQDIAYFRFSKWRPSSILDFHIFAFFVWKIQICAYFYVTMQYLVKIGRLCYCVFSIFKMNAVHHLEFSYFGNFCENLNLLLFLHCYAKFGEDRTIHSRVIAYIWFSKWQLSAIVNLIWRRSRPSTTCIWRS